MAKSPGRTSALNDFPIVPEHLNGARSAWLALVGLKDGIRPADILAHLDAMDESDPIERRRIYSGVMACEQERGKFYAEQVTKHGNP